MTVAAAVFFGFYPTATRAVYADGGNAVFIILLMVFARMSSLLGFCLATKRRIFRSKKETASAARNGVYQAVSIITLLASMQFIPGPMAISIVFGYPMVIYLYMVSKGEQPVQFFTILALIISVIGLGLVINLHGHTEAANWTGIGLAAVAMLATATRVYIYGKELESRDPAAFGAENFVFVLLFCSLLMLYELPVIPLTAYGWGWGLVGATLTSLGTFCMFYGLSYIGAFKYAFFSKLEPIFAAVIAAVAINDVLSFWQYVGIVMVLGSLSAYQFLARKKAHAA